MHSGAQAFEEKIQDQWKLDISKMAVTTIYKASNNQKTPKIITNDHHNLYITACAVKASEQYLQ